MRNFILLFTLILFSTYSFGQKKIDQNLVGFWKSTIYPTKNDPIKGNAFIDRKADGTFTLFLELIYNNDSIYAKEVGHWNTNNDLYTEIGEEYNDEFSYKINQNQVNFKLKKKKQVLGFRSEKFDEEKSSDQTSYYEEQYSIFKAKSMQKLMNMSDKINGFSHDSSDGVQDARLVGIWEGSEKDNQIEGVSKEWTMTRNIDGTFVLDFKTKMKGRKTENHIEKGKWWVKDNKFYEYHEDSGMTDVYTFEVLNVNQIKFKVFDLSFNQNNNNYEFIDTRKK